MGVVELWTGRLEYGAPAVACSRRRAGGAKTMSECTVAPHVLFDTCVSSRGSRRHTFGLLLDVR